MDRSSFREVLGRDLQGASTAPSELAADANGLSKQQEAGEASMSAVSDESGIASGNQAAQTPTSETPSADTTNSTDGSVGQGDGAAAGGAGSNSGETDGDSSETDGGLDADAAAAAASGLVAQAFLAPTQPAFVGTIGSASTSVPSNAAASAVAAGASAEVNADAAPQAKSAAAAVLAQNAAQPDASDAPAQPSARDPMRPVAEAPRDSAGISSQPIAVNGDAAANQDRGGAQDQRGGTQSQQPDAQTRMTARAEQTLTAVSQAMGAAKAVAANSAGSTDAVAGRLSEVEASLARDRVVSSLEQGILNIDAQAGGAAANSPDAAGTGMKSAATMQFGAANATNGETGLAAVLGEAAADPAADLARPSRDPAPIGRLAAKGIDILSNQRGGAITMRLDPPALGQLRIELQISQGAVVADFTAATAEARVLLEANLGMLRERLESQGLAVERMTVHGGRGTETAPVATASQGGDLRQDPNGSGSDARDRGDRSGGRQDAADGESRGRRDGEQRRERHARGERQEEAGFRGLSEAQRVQDAARLMRKAV
jgi:flagellar hook-length control protein FliK